MTVRGGIIEEKNAAGSACSPITAAASRQRVETETGNVQENRYDAEGLRFELLESAGEPALYTTMESFCRRREEKSRAPVIISGRDGSVPQGTGTVPTTTGRTAQYGICY